MEHMMEFNRTFKFGANNIIPPELLTVPRDDDKSSDEEVFYI